MPQVRKSLLQLTFSGASMRRWNDKLCPVALHETDKQAHKMIVAWLLAELNSRDLSMEDRLCLQHQILERALFDYFYRLIITDIKPPIFYRIRENAENYRKLTHWVMDELRPILEPLGKEFWNRFNTYHSLSCHDDLADRILTAAHFFASGWEFKIIRQHNSFDEEMDDISRSFEDKLYSLRDVRGVTELLGGSANDLGRFANLCGQLRFQIRWASTPRVPETSVLGHMFLVACFSYYFSLAVGACRARMVNNFFAGLFHDLPELLTRDIINPVKQSVPELAGIIRECEQQELERRVFGALRRGQHEDLVKRLRYFLGLDAGSEFYETICRDGKICRLHSFEELQEKGNRDDLDPKDGTLLKVCDTLAAFMEAHTSVRGGISSPHLVAAMARIRSELHRMVLGPVSVGALLADFD